MKTRGKYIENAITVILNDTDFLNWVSFRKIRDKNVVKIILQKNVKHVSDTYFCQSRDLNR